MKNDDQPIKSDARSKLNNSQVSAVFSCMLCLPVGFVAFRDRAALWESGKGLMIFMLLICAFGLLTLYIAYMNMREWLRFDETPLRFESECWRTGETARGSILVNRNYRKKKYKMSLSCIQYRERKKRNL